MSRVVALTGLPGSPVPATIGMTWIRDGPRGIPASHKEMPQLSTAVMPDPDKVATFHTCQTRPGFSLACCLWR